MNPGQATDDLHRGVHAEYLLDELRARFPDGSTVSYYDKTLAKTSVRKPVTGTSTAGLTSQGVPFIRIVTDDSTIDTLPENVTLLRTPHSKILPKDNPLDLLP